MSAHAYTQGYLDAISNIPKGITVPFEFLQITKSGNEAIFLSQVVYWLSNGTNGKPRSKYKRKGVVWAVNTTSMWAKQLHWDARTVRTVVKNLKENRLIECETHRTRLKVSEGVYETKNAMHIRINELRLTRLLQQIKSQNTQFVDMIWHTIVCDVLIKEGDFESESESVNDENRHLPDEQMTKIVISSNDENRQIQITKSSIDCNDDDITPARTGESESEHIDLAPESSTAKQEPQPPAKPKQRISDQPAPEPLKPTQFDGVIDEGVSDTWRAYRQYISPLMNQRSSHAIREYVQEFGGDVMPEILEVIGAAGGTSVRGVDRVMAVYREHPDMKLLKESLQTTLENATGKERTAYLASVMLSSARDSQPEPDTPKKPRWQFLDQPEGETA